MRRSSRLCAALCTAAVAAFSTALRLDPKKYGAHKCLADCYAALGDTKASQRHQKLYYESK